MLIGSAKPDVANPAPVTTVLEIVTLLVPAFCRVMVCEPLVPAVTIGKLALIGVAASCGCGVLVTGGGPPDAGFPPLPDEFDPMTTPAQPLPISAAASTSATIQLDVLLTYGSRRAP